MLESESRSPREAVPSLVEVMSPNVPLLVTVKSVSENVVKHLLLGQVGLSKQSSRRSDCS